MNIDAVVVDPAESYEMAGVYSFGRGLFRRENLSGAETTYKVLHRLLPFALGNFVLVAIWIRLLVKLSAA